MKSLLIYTAFVALLFSCGEKTKKKKWFFYKPIVLENSLVNQVGLKFSSLKAEELTLSTGEVGIFSETRLTKTSRRYLRDKILRFSFLNLAAQKDKSLLDVTFADELRFYPGEFSGGQKLLAMRHLEESEGMRASWQLKGKLELQGLKKTDKIENIVIGLGSYSEKDGDLSHYGADLLSKTNGSPLVFSRDNSESVFLLSYENLSNTIIKKMTSANSSLFLEVQDFEINGVGKQEYLDKIVEGKRRIIISTPEKESFYLVDKKLSLVKFLKDLDDKVIINRGGQLERLLGLEQDNFFTIPDRNILNQRELYRDKKIWWSNVKGSLDSFNNQDVPVIFLYTSLEDLRKSRLHWERLETDFVELNVDEPLEGIIQKSSIEYTFVENHNVVPYEIGTEECMEDDRFERKGVDCHIRWRPSFFYPIGKFRYPKTVTHDFRELKPGEVQLIQGENSLLVNGDGVLSVHSTGGKVIAFDEEKPTNIDGGFVQWSKYDNRLNSYHVRAPHTDLKTYKIKKGFKNKYSFNGWRKVFRPLN